MRIVVLAVVSGLALVAAFPPIRLFWLVVPALMGLVAAVERAADRRRAALVGFVFGIAFFGLLYPWIGELGTIALVPLVLVEAAFPAGFAWAVKRWSPVTPSGRVIAVTGMWAASEMLRVRIPVGGFGWGLVGYPLGELAAARAAAAWIGTSGWSVLVVAMAVALVSLFEAGADRRSAHVRVVAAAITLPVLLMVAGAWAPDPTTGAPVRVAVVQGSTPCPQQRCSGERAAIFARHLELTASIPAGSVDLVVWPEGSTGHDVDPVLDPVIGSVIGAQAARIGAVMLVGGDRPVSDTEWINANVVFDARGRIVGEYRKRHPVPFGEYVPARPLFDWIPDLRRVPRDMVRGPGPVVFDEGFGPFGSVISFESSFARYTRQTVGDGARMMIVATSQASYPFSNASDQLIGMTRMRAAENGVDVVHSAVTGRSTIITDGGVVQAPTELVASTVIYGTVSMRSAGPTLYTRLGDWLQYVAVMTAVAAVAASRRSRARPTPDLEGEGEG